VFDYYLNFSINFNKQSHLVHRSVHLSHPALALALPFHTGSEGYAPDPDPEPKP
jgi:hypothetical protein